MTTMPMLMTMTMKLHRLHRRVPPGGIEVGLEKVVERSHMQLLCEEDVVGDVLHDLAHQSEAAFDPRMRLHIHDSGFARRH